MDPGPVRAGFHVYLLLCFLRFLSDSSSCWQLWATSSVKGSVGATPSGSWSQTMSAFGSPSSPVTVIFPSGTPASRRVCCAWARVWPSVSGVLERPHPTRTKPNATATTTPATRATPHLMVRLQPPKTGQHYYYIRNTGRLVVAPADMFLAEKSLSLPLVDQRLSAHFAASAAEPQPPHFQQ